MPHRRNDYLVYLGFWGMVFTRFYNGFKKGLIGMISLLFQKLHWVLTPLGLGFGFSGFGVLGTFRFGNFGF